MTAVIRGIGVCVPPKIVTNDDISKTLDTSDLWIRERTGIERRYMVDGEISTMDLAIKAGLRAIESAQTNKIDMVIVATTSPERLCPAVAPEVADKMGLKGVAAYDITSACAGFVYGMATAKGFVESGIADTVLLIGAEAFTKFVNKDDRTTWPIFGDGAGAMVIGKGEPDELGAIGQFDLGADGSLSDALCTHAGGARQRVKDSLGQHAQSHAYYLSMNGRVVYENAVSQMTQSSLKAVRQNDLTIEELDWMIGHQANIRILQTVAYELDLPECKVASNIADHGNTLTASIPLLLNDYAHSNQLKPGQKLLITAFGAGFSWGSTVVTWPDLRTYQKEWN
ncbi:3-oxoacyl-ACP synthase [Pseudoalteromonas sp. GCY]|uniref:beta-ketoacyl-ACP synthase III n=1 Tax=Pseudoalteromonas sp. GCY TaxID=2003316 RepID=UPI000BFEB070|nr:beta-ketoacyl-ACP synthase III [Pseudoalteromonas sp. GCY]PHI35899.1 3-oxoacyl-ACP synthase [Pseudoalteromonas sp. GCY]QQQ68624.1 ketoacyl-ACP synthase III [Pseudoalteromonas sp. GCY]